MAMRFNVILNGIKNDYYAELDGTNDRVLFVDAYTTPRTDSTSVMYLKLRYSAAGIQPSILDMVADLEAEGVWIRGIKMIANQKFTGGGTIQRWFGIEMINGVDNTGSFRLPEMTGVKIDMGYTTNFAVATPCRMGTIFGILINVDTLNLPATVNSYVNGISLSYRANSVNCLKRLGAVTTAYFEINQVQAQPETSWSHMVWTKMAAATSLAFNPTVYYGGVLEMDAMATISTSFYHVDFDTEGKGGFSASGIKGTITNNTSIYHAEWGTKSSITTARLVTFHALWDISTTTVTDYSAVLSADINANNRAFSVYGSRIDIDGIIGGGATWRGHYLNTVGVSCGAGRTLYGFDIDMSTMVSGGGSIAAFHLGAMQPNTAMMCIGQATVPPGNWGTFNGQMVMDFHTGPKIIGGVWKDDDFNDITWAAAGTSGVKWVQRLSAGPGTIALISPAAGGVVNIKSLAATDPTYLAENNVLTVYLNYAPYFFTRMQTLEVANTLKTVGWTDAVNAAGNIPWTTDAVLVEVDTSIGAFFYSVGVRAGAVTRHQIAALDGNFHRFMFTPAVDSAGVFDGYNVWMDGVIVPAAKLTAAECPLLTTALQRLPGLASNLAAAVNSNLRVDAFKDGMLRNPGPGET